MTESTIFAQTRDVQIDSGIAAVRNFNRFYTRQIGLLREGLLDSPFSLTQVRVLYEIAHRQDCSASDLCQSLGLDPGYLSRLLRGFSNQKLVARKVSPKDARQSCLRLTATGRKVFQGLDLRQEQETRRWLQKLPPHRREQLVTSLRTAQRLLEGDREAEGAVLLRPPRAGDLGWVVHRHGVLYSEEERYDERFEGLVAAIAGAFVENFDAKRERCWIAEKNGEVAGFVFLVRKSAKVCKLRLLLVEPWARGLGIGRRLISECVQFARQAGFQKMMLWTQSDLLPARRLYKQAGFRLVKEERHNSWGREGLISEIWELQL